VRGPGRGIFLTIIGLIGHGVSVWVLFCFHYCHHILFMFVFHCFSMLLEGVIAPTLFLETLIDDS
jgi:hypothetical protein